jgi:site-specific DNA recombinase
MTETRVLVAARLSRLVKGRDQLSIEYQDQQAQAYASEGDRVIVATAADAGVSGSVSPFKRPKLGPYLTDNPPEDWTELVASAIDRLGRNARDLADLRHWCEDRGKRITILDPRLHWPPAENDFASPIVWVVLEQLAEIELRQTKHRYETRRQLLRDRKSMIGRPCWGFNITGPLKAKTLTPDPAKRSYLLKMVEMAEHGQSIADIAHYLTSEGATPAAWEWWAKRDPEKRGPEPSRDWDPKSVGQILRNESLYGVYRESGKILLHHEGVINKERWQRLQAKLDANPKRRGPTRNEPMMLTDVLYCAVCGGVMHAKRNPGPVRKDGTRYVWVGYRCDHTKLGEDERGKPILADNSTCHNMIPADDIEPWVDMWATESAEGNPDIFAFGDREIVETVHVPAKGHADEVAEVDQEIDALDKNNPGYLAEVNRLYAQRARLIALGTEPAHTEDRPTGILLMDYWPTLDTAEKRDYLVRAGVKIHAVSSGHGDEVEGPFRRLTGDPARIVGALTLPATVQNDTNQHENRG